MISRNIHRLRLSKLFKTTRTKVEESCFYTCSGKPEKSNTNKTTYQFWQQNNHPVELATNEMIDQRLDYIHNNPVEAGIVLSPEHYLYISAINFAGLPEKLIDVIFI